MADENHRLRGQDRLPIKLIMPEQATERKNFSLAAHRRSRSERSTRLSPDPRHSGRPLAWRARAATRADGRRSSASETACKSSSQEPPSRASLSRRSPVRLSVAVRLGELLLKATPEGLEPSTETIESNASVSHDEGDVLRRNDRARDACVSPQRRRSDRRAPGGVRVARTASSPVFGS